ncbi:hypothetical protein L226DRAFT_533919 [Lentinus tigrinus ALCF2SS1-7]|uniref:DUF6534 domain-containing protein n=1 Tax=Lentinus tigrinus ALCF2SS1-6 TaxID=1328759 RepID=A0A5C2S9V4_9APHY|nr:hypothetical protein L227DRAFT_91911 [Lentinus tigrinus ALCF2SS1-6]RPD75844.1 hypothetical protein L226DRAFT_533919 [Lentinus tigrinus ALCF2SS1-7]
MASLTLPAMDNTYGAWLLGSYACLLLQGTIFHQTYRYFKLYPRDATYLKIWVIAVNVIELVMTAMVIHAAYYYMVTHAFDVQVLLEKPVWSVSWLATPATLSALIVEMFFARRLWLVGPQFKPVVMLAVLLNLGFFACFLAQSVLLYVSEDPAASVQYSYLASVAAGLVGISDIMVTASLIHVLHTMRTGIRQTNSKLDLLIKYAVSTGLLICVFNVLNVGFSVAYPHNWIYVGISIAMTKLYATTFLVSLNARHSLMSSDVLRLEQSMLFVSDTTQPKRTTGLVFAGPSTLTSAPTSASGNGDEGPIIELKPMQISGSDSETDVKRPWGRGGDDSV